MIESINYRNKSNLQFDNLCSDLKLGRMLQAPKAISGGLLHRMYFIETEQGKYAVKALNPKIMLRPTAMQRYIESERIANIAANHVPALPAKSFNGKFIHEIVNQFYIVFDWAEGASLKPYEINDAHCGIIGCILAAMHNTDFSALSIPYRSDNNEPLTDWDHYLNKGQAISAVWVGLLKESIDKLYDWNAQANVSKKLLATDLVISHRDLDPKNVLWNEGNPLLIDWESAGYINPMQDLMETAIYWSEDEAENIDRKRFLAFVRGYMERRGILHANWSASLSSGFLSKLGWLEYNLKRSLMIECTDAEEQQLGVSQVIETISSITHYAELIPEIEGWLKDI